MKALYLIAPGQWEFQELDRPSPSTIGSGEAIVRVHRVGICGTDYHAFRGNQPFFKYPRILGHELGVEVLAVGAGCEPLKVGDRGAIEPYMGCGTCVACRNGRPNCCARIQVIGVHADGGLREEFTCPARYIHTSPSLSYDHLALVEPMAIGAHAVNRAKVEAGEIVLVIGAGPIGLAVIQFALLAGARVIVFDLEESRLALCRSQMGIRDTVGPCVDAMMVIRDLTNGEGSTIVFDATGNLGSMERSFEFVANGGRLVFVGLSQGQVKFDDPLFHQKELTLMGSRNTLYSDFRWIIAAMEESRIDIRPWVTHRAPFHSLPEAFDRWLRPESAVIKALVDMD